MKRLFHNYSPYKAKSRPPQRRVLISNDQGEADAYAMWKAVKTAAR